jgi:hypothetical protein
MRLAVLLLAFTTTCFSQAAPPGIYIVYTFAKKGKCEQEVKMLIGNTKVCISKKPILGINEIVNVSDIIYDRVEEASYINVLISSKGVETLNKIFELLPKSQFVFVLENNGLGSFTITKEITTPIMRLGADVDLNNLQLIHALLKRAQPTEPD